MKRLFALKILFAAALFASAICVFTSAYALGADYSYIKVGLYYSDSAPSSVSLKADGGFNYGYVGAEGYVSTGTVSETEITVSAGDAGEVTINGTTNINISDSNLTLYPDSGLIYLNGSAYRGAVMLTNNSGYSLTVINYLPLEQYLYGVIGSEMPSSWNLEALKAQAVCARSFAISNWSKHSSLGFNVCSTTNCQVYNGVSAETASTVQAVDETSGKVLMYDGSIAQTLFFSTSGGYTADAAHVWGSSIPYLCGVEDPYENPDEASRHSWTVTLSGNDIKNVLSNLGIDIGEITGVSAKSDSTEHVYELTVSGTNGSHTFKNQEVCSAFYPYGVLSQKYTVTPYGDDSNIYAASSSGVSSVPSFSVISGNGEISSPAAPYTLLSSQGLSKYELSSASGYIFNGGGWGHGVGMSQYGAKGMADNGFSYDEILYHYYPGTYLE